MITFDELLKCRNKAVLDPTPFWKLHITEEEADGLAEYVKLTLDKMPMFEALDTKGRKCFYARFDREVCLLYALWWNKKYNGGKTSWERMLSDYGISQSCLDWVREAAMNELKIGRRLRIPIYCSENKRHMYLQSLLAQGGLPMQIMNGETRTSLENYIYYLVLEYETMDARDWSNVSVAKTLADRYLFNKTLRESEAVLEFSMEILKAYFQPELAEYDDQGEIQEIINRVRKKVGQTQRIEKKYFKIGWELKIAEGGLLELYYSVSVPHEVYLDETLRRDADNNMVNVVSYSVANQLVGEYYRQNDRYLLMPGTANDQRVKWERNQDSLSLKRKIKVDIQEDKSLINSEPPYFGVPMLLQFKNGYWIPNQIRNNETLVCLAPQGWKCSELDATAKYEYEGNEYLWMEIDKDNVSEILLHFTNQETGETMVLDNRISDYSVSFSPTNPSWIDEADDLVVVNQIDFRNIFRFFLKDEPCSRERFRFSYRTQANMEFVVYRGGPIPCGPIEMKVDCPDGICGKRFTFFNIDGLNVDYPKPDALKVCCNNGELALLAGQNIEISDGCYRVVDANNLGGFAPVRFRFYPVGQSKSVSLGFTTPIKKSCFFDVSGNMLCRGFRVALSELHKYKFNLVEKSQIVLSYFVTTGNTESCVTKKKMSMPAGRYPLDVLRDEIDRLVCINGFNDYHKFIKIKIGGVDAEIVLRFSAYIAQQCENTDGTKGILVKHNDNPKSGLSIHAVAVNVSEDSPLYRSDDIILVEDELESGKYYLPQLDDPNAKQFVVFSDNSSYCSGMSPFFLNLDSDMNEEERNKQKSESITHIQQNLMDGDEQEWKNVWFYMELVMNYHLSYLNSFNVFLAIANSPNLLTEFIVRLVGSDLMKNVEQGRMINELQRMERDLSFRFHYLPSVCWKKQQTQIEKEYDALILIEPKFRETISREDFIDSKFSILKTLLFSQLGEGNQYAIPVYHRIMGKEWPTRPDFNPQVSDYMFKVNDALSDLCSLNSPEDLDFVQVEYSPLRKWNEYRSSEILQKLEYLAVILPQCAAQYVHGANMDLWQYQPDSTCNVFIRRMINYMATYAPEAYNELFITALLRNPVKQLNDK